MGISSVTCIAVAAPSTAAIAAIAAAASGSSCGIEVAGPPRRTADCRLPPTDCLLPRHRPEALPTDLPLSFCGVIYWSYTGQMRAKYCLTPQRNLPAHHCRRECWATPAVQSTEHWSNTASGQILVKHWSNGWDTPAAHTVLVLIDASKAPLKRMQIAWVCLDLLRTAPSLRGPSPENEGRSWRMQTASVALRFGFDCSLGHGVIRLRLQPRPRCDSASTAASATV